MSDRPPSGVPTPVDPVVRDYLRLGLRFGCVVEGFVDAYTGDPALAAEVAAEPTADPAQLARDAQELVLRVRDAGYDLARTEYLVAHLEALAVAGRRLAGAPMSFVDEVRSYFQVDIALVDTDVYAQAHDRVGELLGGHGPVGPRLAAARAPELCPPEAVESAVRQVAAALRQRVAAPTGLPTGEHIEFAIERDVAWSGFNYYLGGFRSRVAVNADVGHRTSGLGALVAHECYPGHHTEHCRKELVLVDRQAELEHTIFLVNTPQCLMAEGLGDLALSAAIGPGWGRWLVEVLADVAGPDGRPVPTFDPELAEALELASRPLNTVRQNAAILLNDHGADPEEVLQYLQRWMLVDERRARQMMRFITDPLWRAYTSTYVEGERLLRPWLEARPDGTTALQRFQRLLDEPLTPRAIRQELAGPATTR
ncbi:DUF885 domain-containing protein [Nakamurella leprariae]|uniref:DUF885 domain-containing protein n=1 Tax=Nakamurella leprariae TaxID=2803911 RepID=A0A938YFE8_9ACTN|nr:DUF885 domain-containing protein [Nakamurella leprariae]MBM9468583.1 DUF885 domain-containing protein [Nakamurella leprariae]